MKGAAWSMITDMEGVKQDIKQNDKSDSVNSNTSGYEHLRCWLQGKVCRFVRNHYLSAKNRGVY